MRDAGLQWQAEQELAAAGRRLLLWMISGHADPFRCSLRCPYAFIWYNSNSQETAAHGNTHAHMERLTGPFSDCDQQTQFVFRDEQPVPRLWRTVG